MMTTTTKKSKTLIVWSKQFALGLGFGSAVMFGMFLGALTVTKPSDVLPEVVATKKQAAANGAKISEIEAAIDGVYPKDVRKALFKHIDAKANDRFTGTQAMESFQAVIKANNLKTPPDAPWIKTDD
jgi:hypothetical protein